MEIPIYSQMPRELRRSKLAYSHRSSYIATEVALRKESITAWLRVCRKCFFVFFFFLPHLLVLPFMRWQTLVQWAEGKYEVQQGSRLGEDVGKPRCLVGG